MYINVTSVTSMLHILVSCGYIRSHILVSCGYILLGPGDIRSHILATWRYIGHIISGSRIYKVPYSCDLWIYISCFNLGLSVYLLELDLHYNSLSVA